MVVVRLVLDTILSRRAPQRIMTPEAWAAHQKMYGRGSGAVVETDPRANATHERWKQRESADAAALLYPLIGLCRSAGLPVPVPEFTFHTVRKWRFDYAWPDALVAVEIEGGVWTQGRHTRGSGFLADMEKYNAATLLGWRLLRYVPDELHYALPQLQQLFGLLP